LKKKQTDNALIEKRHAELAAAFARCRCSCGCAPVSFAPGEAEIREAGILLQRAKPLRGFCLRCLGLADAVTTT
jgi:hypothetical protein